MCLLLEKCKSDHVEIPPYTYSLITPVIKKMDYYKGHEVRILTYLCWECKTLQLLLENSLAGVTSFYNKEL